MFSNTIKLIFLILFSSSVAFSDDKLSNVIEDIFLDRKLDSEPACAIGVIENNKYIFQSGFGLSNLEHDIEITSDSVFRIGSISKQFTATAIALLEERGLLSLDDPINKYIPDLIKYDHDVTIRHLIHHFSGLGDYEYSDYPGRFVNAVGEEFRWGNQDYMSNQEIYSLFKSLPLIMKPETKFWYSNLGYGLLTLVIENITGVSLREFAEKEIFGPLEMNDSFFNDNVNLIVKNRADAYSLIDKNKQEYVINMTNLSNIGDGGVYTTINDFIKWDNNFYKNILGNRSNNLLAQMKTNFFGKTAENIKKANDVYRDEDTYAFAQNFDYKNGYKRWSHSGSWVGYTAHYSRYEDINFSVVVFCNNEEIDAQEVSDIIVDFYLD